MGKPGFPTCGEPVEPHPCLWGRQPLPPAVRTWGNRVSPFPLPEVTIRGNRVSPPAVSLSNRTPAGGGASRFHQGLRNGATGFPHLR